MNKFFLKALNKLNLLEKVNVEVPINLNNKNTLISSGACSSFPSTFGVGIVWLPRLLVWCWIISLAVCSASHFSISGLILVGVLHSGTFPKSSMSSFVIPSTVVPQYVPLSVADIAGATPCRIAECNLLGQIKFYIVGKII